jgi:putative inorganic carbon (hco3(-)) transporter
LKKRTDFIALIVVTILFSYAISIGTTFNGILTPDFHIPTLSMIALTIAVWLLVHWRRGWVWHRTPLDGVFVLWVLAFGLSLVTNLEVWRRVVIGLWYVTAYIGAWYILHDVIANEGIPREIWVDGLLIAGLVVVIFGFVQSRDWFTNSFPLMLSGLIPFNLPRPVSTLGNPNTLGNVLVVIIPFSLARSVSARLMVGRVVMGIYTLAALFLLVLTYSRGAWIGIAAGLGIWGILWLAQHEMLSHQALGAWWSKHQVLVRVITVGVGLAGVVAALFVIVVFLRSFNEAGRSTGLRSEIYQTAITMFTEKPLAGHGLFTFGRGLARLQSVPPTTAHSHAHDAPLHIAAELGLVGLVALAATLWVMAQTARSNWPLMTQRQRGMLSAAVAAVVAFAVHQLTDIPAMTPAVVLVGLVALALMMTSVKPVPLSSAFRRQGHPFSLAGTWFVLIVTGVWSSQIYSDYFSALIYGRDTQDFRGAASQMQSAIDADPALYIQYKEQGFLLGLAANEGDENASQDAIEVYQRFIALEPDYAIVWANMASLQWQLGQREVAYESMGKAFSIAPESWQLAVNLGNYAAELGETEVAENAYAQAVELLPDITLLPELERFQSDDLNLTTTARAVLLLENGQVDEAAQALAENPLPKFTSKYVIDALVALAQNNRAEAETALATAERVVMNESDRQWLLVGRARLARFDSDDGAAQSALEEVQELLQRGSFESDFVEGINVALAQSLRNGYPRQFLPQVYYPVDDPVLLHLVANT